MDMEYAGPQEMLEAVLSSRSSALFAGKLANYAKCQRLCDTLFIVFSIVFFITRLVIYPFWVIRSVLIESWEIVGPYRSWWLLNGLLLVLQVLHIIWFYLIARIAIKAIFKGKTLLPSPCCRSVPPPPPLCMKEEARGAGGGAGAREASAESSDQSLSFSPRILWCSRGYCSVLEG
ncbi:hypothetical protein CRUP_004264 [Coryphaenoides rupestris]|nr:hypothetical protein CRUP_004264 [Coryphaenoides rupestris]